MGRVLAIDHGERRSGLALSDPDQTLASPLAVVEGEQRLLEEVGEIVRSREVECVVVGLPLNMDGSAGERVERVLRFRDRLEAWLAAADLPRGPGSVAVETLDERLTTLQAESALRAGGVSRRRRKLAVDKVAAQILLQCFLDRKKRLAEDDGPG